MKTPATAAVLEKKLTNKRSELTSRRTLKKRRGRDQARDTHELELELVCALGVTVEVTNEVEVIVTTWPPDVVTIWAVVGIGVAAVFEADDDCADVAEEDADDAVEEEDDGADDAAAFDVVDVGSADVGAGAVVEGLVGDLCNQD